TRLDFNTVEQSATTYIRRVGVTEIATGHTTMFKDVPSENAYYPVWSPDGQWIAFTFRRNSVWDLALIKPDGTGFSVIKKGEEKEVTLYSPCWGHDNKTIFCENMSTLFQLGLDGCVLKQWTVERIVPNGDMRGDGR